MADYAFNGRASDDGDREGRTVSNLLTAELMTEHKRNNDHRNLNKKLRTEIYFTLPLSIIERSTNYTRYSVDTCLTQSRVFVEPS